MYEKVSQVKKNRAIASKEHFTVKEQAEYYINQT